MAKLDYQSPKREEPRAPRPFKEVTLPLILLALGLFIIATVALSRTNSFSGFVSAIEILVLVMAVQTGLGILAAVLTRRIVNCDLGNEQTAMLKISATVVFASAFGTFMPPFYGIVPVLLVFVGLMMLFFELDRFDAVIFTIIFFVARIIAGIALAAFLK